MRWVEGLGSKTEESSQGVPARILSLHFCACTTLRLSEVSQALEKGYSGGLL